ncbi:hypothetical protein HRbin32_02167 [bacterium HR32]|nr:hypothetical protein HRbin32_02167 [bacterium HR32]
MLGTQPADERAHAHPFRRPHRGYGPRGPPGVRHRAQPQRFHACPGGLAEPAVPLVHRRQALLLQQPQGLLQAEEHGHRGREGRLRQRRPQRLGQQPHIPVVPGHPGLLVRLPRPRARTQEAHPRRAAQRLLRRRHHHVQPQAVHLYGDGSERAHRVHEQQGGVVAAGLGQRLQVVLDAGGGLVVREQHRPVRLLAQLRLQPLRRDPLAPLHLHPGDLRAVGLGDAREAVAERPARERQDLVPGRQGVHHRSFQDPRPRARVGQHGLPGSVQHRDPVQDVAQDPGEGFAAVVRHGPCPRFPDRRGDRGGAWDQQQLVHPNTSLGSQQENPHVSETGGFPRYHSDSGRATRPALSGAIGPLRRRLPPRLWRWTTLRPPTGSHPPPALSGCGRALPPSSPRL